MFYVDENGFFNEEMYYEARRLSTVSGSFERICVQKFRFLGREIRGVNVTVFRTNGGRESLLFDVNQQWIEDSLIGVFICQKRKVKKGDMISFIVRQNESGVPSLMIIVGNWVLFPCVVNLSV